MSGKTELSPSLLNLNNDLRSTTNKNQLTPLLFLLNPLKELQARQIKNSNFSVLPQQNDQS